MTPITTTHWARRITLFLLLLPTVVLADETTTLQTIMQGLRDNLVEIADGLLNDDFEMVERGASAIANHPRIPPGQVRLIAAELGNEMPAFKQLDSRVHDLSMQISAAASNGDKAAAISGFGEMINGCFACHDAYKDRVAGILRAPS
jgi:cytochrome c553